MIYADQRWIGNHGIGRFARHVLADLIYRPVSLNTKPSAPLDSWFLGLALRKLEDTDVFFSPGYNTPLFCAGRIVFTVHDLTPIYCPEGRRAHIRLYYETMLKRACHHASDILTVSEFSRHQIIEWSGVGPDKVINVGNGVESRYRPDGDSYPLPFPYLLCVSNRKPHKNERRIVKAFATAALDSRIHLVFTGICDTKLARDIEAHGLRSRVNFIGEVVEEKFPSLYRGAKALVFPSLYEGFGLPILEAMACGTPVLTSNATAMPELAGNAALLVDARSVEEISRGLEQIVNDISLREQVREKGLVRAAEFSWEKTSYRVGQVLEGKGLNQQSGHT